jgi:hypothetical protein
MYNLISPARNLVCISNCLFILSSFNFVNFGSYNLDEGYCALVYRDFFFFFFFFSFFTDPVFYLHHCVLGMILRLEFMEWISMLCWSALVTVLAVVVGARLVLGSSIGSQKRMP